MRALFQPRVEGLEHVPVSGGAILASNHLSFSDSFFLPLVVPRRITFLAKSDYFTGRGVKGRLTAGFFRGVGQVPVDRTGGSASEGALSAGLRILNSGQLLGIYPEGTRSPDGRLYRGKTGVARMALEARVPVLPVAMVGTDKVQPTGQKIPRLGRVGVLIGEPLDLTPYYGREDDRAVLRSITDQIMRDLTRLSGQEYVDIYAATMKEQLAESVRERVAAARERAQAAAASAAARAAETRARVEQARARVEEDARVRVDEGRAKVEQARARVDHARDEGRAKVEQARARVDHARDRLEAEARGRVEDARAKVEDARAKFEQGRAERAPAHDNTPTPSTGPASSETDSTGPESTGPESTGPDSTEPQSTEPDGHPDTETDSGNL
jgi:1-acyl-sn-glycerol-3-phosphate acyltransferase